MPTRLRTSARFLLCFLLVAVGAQAHGPAPPRPLPRSGSSLQPGDNARLLANLDQHDFYNDVSGYHSASGVEVAILGTDLGTAFIDTTDPRHPVEIAFITGPASKWRELDTFGHHTYAVSEGGGGMQIFDLSNPLAPVLVKTWGDQIWSHAHTIHIDRTAGNAYINGTDVGMVVVSLQDPVNPVYLASFTDDYVHDCFVQNGIAHLAHIKTGLYRTLDVSQLPALHVLDVEATPGHAAHSATVTADNRVSVVADETAQGHVSVWDTSNPSDLKRLSEFTTGTGSIAHNPYMIGNIAHCSWYTDGYVAIDLSDPRRPKKLASYDTYPGSSGGFHGAWSCYPYQPSGAIYIGDINTGLYVIEVKCYPAVTYGDGVRGSGGFMPRLETEEFAAIGNANFHVEMTDLFGGNVAVLFVGFGRGSLPFHQGTLLVDLTPFLAVTFNAQGSGPGAGTFTLPMPIPADAALVGLQVNMQVAQDDSGAPGMVSMSAGLEFKVCDPN